MKVEEAKQKVCPIMSQGQYQIKCMCNDCMWWIYTKTQREKTEYEKQRREEYNKAIKEISWNTDDLFIVELDKVYDDVINIDLSLPEDEKQGYCQRLKNI